MALDQREVQQTTDNNDSAWKWY